MAELTANIRKTAGKAMMPLAGDLVLLKAGEEMQDELGGIYYGPSTEHPCRGWIANYSDLSKLAAARPISSRKVVILAHTLDVTPDITDKVVIGGETWYVGDVGTDQSGAAWELEDNPLPVGPAKRDGALHPPPAIFPVRLTSAGYH